MVTAWLARGPQAGITSAAQLLESAKGADARRHTAKKLAGPLGGALDTPPVLREFLQSAKGADARRHTAKKLAGPLGGALDTAPVLREFLQRSVLCGQALSPG